MLIDHVDHLVLTVADIDRTVHFYQQVLGMRVEEFGEGRKALLFGHQKINLHQKGQEIEPHAQYPTPGSADLCFITATPIPAVQAELRTEGISIDLGPVERSGASGTIQSVYLRDPDQNLIEVSNYL